MTAAARSFLAAAAALALLEGGLRVGGVDPGPLPIYAASDILVAYAALAGGTVSGLACAALCLLYAALRMPEPDRAMHLAALVVTAPGLALMIGLLKGQAERRHADLVRARMEEGLRQAQKMEAVGRLAGGVAHDFNNLLTVIQTHAGFLARAVPEGDPARHDLERIRAAARRAEALTRQLLILSRHEVVAPRPVDLNRLVFDLADLLRRTLGEHVSLDTALSDALPRVQADPGQIEQVLMNLAMNARDAMPGGGRLTIATVSGRDGDERVRLTVADTGVGMSPEVAARVFEPFFTTKERGKGNGLGLATAYGIVKQAGGEISLETAPGRGTTFTIRLPATDAPVAEPTPPRQAKDSAGRGEALLVVEDEEAVREAAARILRQAGYAVREAKDGEAALLRAGEAPPIALLLTDVIMPGMNGHELAERLRAGRPALAVLYMSGYLDEEGSGLPPSSVVRKPFTEEALLWRVREALDDMVESSP